jgi:hypothetical protein
MKTELRDAQPGDILVFKGSGPSFFFFGWLVKLFYPKWDRWGWHMAFTARKEGVHWLIAEATWPKCLVRYLTEQRGDFRLYRWLDAPPEPFRIRDWINSHVVCKYDIVVYFLSMVSFFWRRTGLEFPRIIDRHYTCWEFVYEFADAMGKPIEDEYQYPMIIDFLEKVGELNSG